MNYWFRTKFYDCFICWRQNEEFPVSIFINYASAIQMK